MPAGLGRRLGALLYEGLLLTAIELIVGFLTLPLVSPSARGAVPALMLPGHTARAFLFVAMVTVAGLYLVHGWTHGRRTLPQKTWRLRLVDRAGRPLGLHQAMVRYLAGYVGPLLAMAAYLVLRGRGVGGLGVWLLALNFLWALIDRERLFLHDRIAGTRLVAGA
jgi:uncharacterized RDD family membrane protein YckC